MKKRIFLWMTCLFMGLTLAQAQEMPGNVIQAFQKGNVHYLTDYLGDQVDLIMDNKASCAGKEGVQKQLATFFAQNKVWRFDVNHQGKRDESSFMVGTLQTGRGNYRVNCFLKRIEDKYFIHQIRIDKAEP